MSDEPTTRDAPAGEAAALRQPHQHPGYAFLVILSALTLAADLGSKWWAIKRLGPDRPFSERKLEVIQGHLSFIFAQNPGGAWGILQDESESIRKPFFVLISVAAVIFIVSLYRKTHVRQWTLKWGLPLVLGGALGNLVDRVRYGYVVDFIQVHVTKNFTWPTFNVADIAIVAGVALMFIDMFVTRKPAAPTAETVASPASPAPSTPVEVPANPKAPTDEG